MIRSYTALRWFWLRNFGLGSNRSLKHFTAEGAESAEMKGVVDSEQGSPAYLQSAVSTGRGGANPFVMSFGLFYCHSLGSKRSSKHFTAEGAEIAEMKH